MSRILPLFPLGNLVFPGGRLSLRIFEPRYVNLVKRSMQSGTGFGVVLLLRGSEVATPAGARRGNQSETSGATPDATSGVTSGDSPRDTEGDVSRSGASAVTTTAGIGTEVSIVDFDRLPDGLLGITCLGQQRFRILHTWREADGLNMAEVEDVPAPSFTPIPADLRLVAEILERLVAQIGIEQVAQEARYDDADWVGCRLAELLSMEAIERQALLEMPDPVERLQLLWGRFRRQD